MLSESDVEDQLLGLMNDERAANGVPPYVRDGALDAGASAHTELLMSKAVVAADPNDPRVPCADRRPRRDLDRVLAGGPLVSGRGAQPHPTHPA
jgi:hypothetical protein